MKKRVALTLLSLLLIAISGFAQVGSSCSTPHVINTLPFTLTGMNTSAGGNAFDTTMACQSQYLTGKDYVFTYTPTSDQTINIALTGTNTGVGLFVINDCPLNPLATCIARIESTTANPTASNVLLHQDSTYYIVISTRVLLGVINTSTGFNINVTRVVNNDLVMSAILKPQSSCALAASDTVKVKVRNYGQLAATGAQIGYSIDGGTPIIENLPTIAAADSLIFKFSQLASLTSPSDMHLKVWTIFAADESHANDTLTYTISHLPLINSYPYFQNFETNAGGWSTGASGTTWAYGVPAYDSISTAASGTHAWVTNLTGNSLATETSYLYSPCIDFSSLALPIIRLKTNYSMSGGIATNAKLQSSVDGGLTWTTVGAQGTDWYTATAGWTGSTSNTWKTMIHKLTGLGGNSSVKLRIAFTTTFNAVPGIGIDDIEIYDSPANDLAVTKIVAPTSSCGLASEQIIIRVKNIGTASQSNYQVGYKVNGGGLVSQPQPAVLAPNDSIDITFTAPYNFSTLGTYQLFVTTILASDTLNANDSLSTSITNTVSIGSFPYLETFEANDGGWVAGGTNSSWQYGVPAGTVINSAVSGTHAWVTNLTGNYNSSENSYLESPCYDLSSLTLPVIEVMLNYTVPAGLAGIGSAYGYIEYSINNGATWSTVGANGDLTNWYNGTTTTTGWTGQSTGWVKSKHTLPFLVGVNKVKFRFHFNGGTAVITQPTEGFGIDNIRIYEMPQKDLSVVSMITPSANCGLTNEFIGVKVTNLGSNSQSNIPIKYTIDGGLNYTTSSIPGPINMNDTIDFTFTTSANFTATQSYDVRVFTDLVGEEDRSNDTLKKTIVNAIIINSFPYNEGFENATNNWTSGGTSSSWEVSNSVTNQTILPSPNGKCWITNASGAYNASENSWVMSPCFDFSSLTDPYIKLNVSYETSSGTINSITTVLEMSTDGGNTWETVGVTGDSTNWYNSGLLSGEGWQGTSDWKTASHTLTSLAGMANVKLRIHFGGNSPLMQPTPTAGFAFDQIEIKNCQHAQLAFTSNVNATTKTVSFTNTSTGATSYLWDFGDGNTDVTTNPTHTYANNGQFVVKLYGYTECSTDSLIQVVNVTDVGIATNNNMIINCAPNPTTGLLNINFSNLNAKEMTLSVIDITNKTLITEQISVDNTQKSHQINLSHLSKGIYFVKISTLKSTVINKIILH